MDRAIVFAGQGAQSVGMGKDLADAYGPCRELYERADDVLGYSLSKLCFEGPVEDLTKSNHCQPAIFVTSMACYTALKAECGDVTFKVAAGLSLGEWTALHAAGALSFEDTLRVLEARGRFMQEACEEQEGGMVSVIGLTGEQLEQICASTGVVVSNYNSDGQTVLAGAKSAVQAAEQQAKDAGAKRTVILRVAGAFHSPLMASAGEKLAAVLADVDICVPSIPVVANVTGSPHADVDGVRRDMVKQVSNTVDWLGCVRWLMDAGIGGYVECGPGRVVTGLIKRIDRSAELHSVQDVATLQKAVQDLS